MSDNTHPVLQSLMGVISSRHSAAEILHKVADAGSWGGFPDDVSCEDLGKALERICLNAPVNNPLTRVVRGWRKAARKRRRLIEG